jgi:hypothetical protein
MSVQEPTIICPNCSAEIKLTESLAAPLVEATRQKFKDHLAKKETEWRKHADDVRKEAEASALEKARRDVTSEMRENEQRIAELQSNLETNNAKLAEAQRMQADVLRKERALEDQKRELELTIEKRVQQDVSAVRDKARQEATEEARLKLAEKDETMQAMQRQIEELRRRAEQGSQQLQGEAQELELESTLSALFPFDKIEPVGKGEFGGDIMQQVYTQQGVLCGSILWESKRTKNWSDTWLPKLRKDQRDAKADIALIVTQAMPATIKAFGEIDGVYVTSYTLYQPVCVMLRNAVISTYLARQSAEGVQTKAELVYAYLSGPQFRQRIEAIAEAFATLQDDLNKERKAITRIWAKREEQLNRAMCGTTGLYGDLQGIAGASLPELEAFELRAALEHDNE